MPQVGERRAPVFNGESEELPRFFDAVEVVAEGAGLGDRDRMLWACRYVKKLTDEETWKTARAFMSATGTWEEFKKEIYRMYPGSEGDRRYTRSDLLRLVEDWGDKGIESKEDLGEFDRVFRRIAMFLEGRGRISKDELDRTYLSAFTGDIRAKLDHRLTLKFPDQEFDVPFDTETVRTCAEYILMGSAPSPMFPTYNKAHKKAESERGRKKDVKSEEFESVKLQLTQLQEQIAAMLALQKNGGPRRSYREQTDQGCRYCNEVGHFVRECPKAAGHIRDGRCKKTEWGAVVLADGSRVPRLPGKSSAECVEFMYPLASAPVNNVANNMFELQPSATSLTMATAREGSDDEEEEAEEEDDGTLLTVQPGFNRLLLVLRDEGVMRFVKYVSAAAQGSRWDICGEYEVGAVQEEDD